MYRIVLKNSDQLIENYLAKDKFNEKVGALMRSYLSAPAWDYYYYGKKKVRLKVFEDSATYRFLDKYSNGAALDKLLTGDFNAQMEIIQDVYKGIPDAAHPAVAAMSHFVPIGKRKDDIPDSDTTEVDDFNSILRHIFEDTIYDGTQAGVVHLDKNSFVKNLGLRVCPYCGRSYIYGIEPKRNKKTVKVKPQIDHFLPKSQFPFLALNFYNMIPSCTPCNLAPAKGEQSPMVSVPNPELRIMHPYFFDDGAVTFRYDPISEAPMDASEIEVNVDYHENDTLKRGYNELFFIDDLYKEHRMEAHDLYLRMKTWKSKAEQAYKALGIQDDYWQMLPLLFFGYPLAEEQAPLRPLFKFNKDVYAQMLHDFETGRVK